jgi:hypothetical protein
MPSSAKSERKRTKDPKENEKVKSAAEAKKKIVSEQVSDQVEGNKEAAAA